MLLHFIERTQGKEPISPLQAVKHTNIELPVKLFCPQTVCPKDHILEKNQNVEV